MTDKNITSKNQIDNITPEVEIENVLVELVKAKERAQKNGDSNSLLVITSLVLIFTMLSTYAPNAQAASLNSLIEKFAEKISKQLTQQLGPMFESIMGVFTDGIGSIMGTEGDRTTESLGKVGDSINQVAITLEKERLKRVTQPRHNGCVFDDYAENEARVSNAAKSKHQKRMATSSERYIAKKGGNNSSPRLADYGRIMTDPTTSSATKIAIIDPSTLDKEKMSTQEVETAKQSIDLLASNARDKLPPIEVNEDSSMTTRLEAGRSASRAMSIELATNTLMKDVSKREVDSSTGESEHSLLKKQIDETYYSPEWRAATQGYGDATPALIDACLQTATTNKILFDLLLGQQEQNKIQAAILLKLNER